MAYNTQNGHLYAQTYPDPGREGQEIAFHEYSKTTFIAAHAIASPEVYGTLKLATDPVTGTLYAVADELERYNTGPDVKRWIFKIDLEANSAQIFAQNDLVGHCCPFHTITIDTNGDIWWVLDPDFWIYRVTRSGESKPFACHVIMDAAVLISDGNDTFYLFHPGGIDKISNNNTQKIIVLTADNPDVAVESGQNVLIYGTQESNCIDIKKSATVKILNNPGNNTITIEADSIELQVSRSGATVTFTDSNGTVLTIPATKTAQTIIFNDITLTLLIETNKVILGNQEVTLNSNPIL